MTIDYRDVLRRYIRHVGECEGTAFIDKLVDNNDPKYKHEPISVRFSAEEIDELRMLDEMDGPCEQPNEVGEGT